MRSRTVPIRRRTLRALAAVDWSVTVNIDGDRVA
jgi:hypothetical protein